MKACRYPTIKKATKTLTSQIPVWLDLHEFATSTLEISQSGALGDLMYVQWGAASASNGCKETEHILLNKKIFCSTALFDIQFNLNGNSKNNIFLCAFLYFFKFLHPKPQKGNAFV